MSTDVHTFPIGLSLAEARSRVVAAAMAEPLSSETVAIESALGRVLADDVTAPFDVPGFDNAAMDGHAVRGDDLAPSSETRLREVGVTFAGGAQTLALGRGECVRIMTGAPLPPGADTVVMKENVRTENGTIVVAAGTPRGANTRAADDDYRRGDAALSAGTVLTPARLGVLAAFGRTRIAVARRPCAVLLTTGDELVPPGEALKFGRIHDSNRYSLGALLERHGATLLRHERLRDDRALLRDALLRASAEADLIVSSGGVSAGEADFLPNLLTEIGRIHFWKARIKPGMPLLCANIDRALMFGLPGNPASGVATFLAFVRPALDAMTRRLPRKPLWARLARRIDKTHERVEFLRARLLCDETGTLLATPLPKQGSGQLRGVAESDVLIVLPEAEGEYPAGTVVEAVPLSDWA